MSNAEAPEALDELVVLLGILPPTPEQARVAIHPPEPLLVVAGAGSGKTETLSLRAAFMAAHYGVPPENILGLTFTRKAAAELEERLRTRLRAWADPARSGDVLGGFPEAATYNGFALSVVREFGPYIGLDPQVTHMGAAAAWQLMSEVVAAWHGDLPAMVGEDGAESSAESVVTNALALRQEIANQAIGLEDARAALLSMQRRFDDARAESGGKAPYIAFHRSGAEALARRLTLLDVIAEFEAQKAALGAMDYADQIAAATRIVEESPEARAALRERHKVVFLDEFQDTSVAQMRFLSALFGDHAVTAVGDPNQAIYGWRGASAASLDDFHERFNSRRDKEGAVLNLSTAWRNDRTVLDVANVISAPLSQPPSWQDRAPVRQVGLPQLRSRPGAPMGHVQTHFSKFQEEEIRQVVRFIADVRATGQPLPSCAVLARRAAPLLRVVAALREAGIPAQLASGEALLMHPAVVDLRAALEVTADLGKSSHLARLLTNLDLGVADLRALSDLAHMLGRSSGAGQAGVDREALMVEAVAAVGGGATVQGMTEVARTRIEGLAGRLKALRAHRDRPITEQVENARAVFSLDANALADPTSAGVSDALDQFAELASGYESEAPRATMGAFLEWLDAVEKQERGFQVPSVNIDPEAVQVMTIHAAKGLEWDAVAVVDMEEGRFPSTRGGGRAPKEEALEAVPPAEPAWQSGWWTNTGMLPYQLRQDSAHLPLPDVWDMGAKNGAALVEPFKAYLGEHLNREERRLAYVAVTRARKWLLLSGSWNDGGRQVYLPSAFLYEGSQVPGVTATTDSSPTQTDVEENRTRSAGSVFPRPPGETRRMAEQVAVRVLEAQRELADQFLPLTAAPDAGAVATERRYSVLASVADRQLAHATELLLAELDEERDLAANVHDNPEDVLRAVAASRDLAVTEVAQFASDPGAKVLDLLRPVPSEPRDRALLGTAFHRWVESQLRTLGAGSADPDLPAATLPATDSLPPAEQQALDAMRRVFMESEWAGRHEVVALEAPFWLPSGDVPVRGRVDAVFRNDDGDYLLVDWKTRNTLPGTFDPAVLRYYVTQLRHYLDAWRPRAQSEGAGLSARLVFVSPEGIKPVTLEELEALLDAQESEALAT